VIDMAADWATIHPDTSAPCSTSWAFAGLMAEVSRRCHDAYADQFESEVGDPLYESVEGTLIWELAMKRGCVGPCADLAVVEFCPGNGIRPTDESDFVHA
jgi:hypothetical protein